MMAQVRRLVAAMSAVALLAGATACTKRPPLPPTGSVDADKFLFDRGSQALQERHWLEAREYFRRLVDSYPNSQYRHEAKLGIGDSYLGEDRVDTLILAANEFREFLTYFPLNPRADYAQYRLAVAQMQQMLGPRRDQTATIAALKEFDTFIENYPNSDLMPEVQKLRREVRDRLSESEFLIGRFHYNNRMYAGALGRLLPLLTDDPGYSHKDEVYFYLGETHMKIGRLAEALPYYQRLLEEFPNSERADDARKRIDEIKRGGGEGIKR
ncbi:MAG: outer membrane protein assembly factor BamD [Vicinamibacterales bacterium]